MNYMKSLREFLIDEGRIPIFVLAEIIGLIHVVDNVYMDEDKNMYLATEKDIHKMSDNEQAICEMTYSEEIDNYRRFLKIMGLPIEHPEGTLVRTIKVELPYCKDLGGNNNE